MTVDLCRTERPALLPGPTGSRSACHRRNEVDTLAGPGPAITG
jgi:hypothetical protein